MEFVYIIVQVMLPVFAILGIGAWLHRAFQFDLHTLGKMNMYFIIPAFTFENLYKVQFSMDLLLHVLLFFGVFITALYVYALCVAWGVRLKKRERISFSHSLMFYNSGNYGIPVNDLAFKHDPLALSIQIVISVLQNILVYSYGAFSLKAIDSGKLKSIFVYFKMPTFYGMFFGIVFNVYDVPVPDFIMKPAEYASESFVAVALLTLGAQVAHYRLSFKWRTVYFSMLSRLVAGPFLAWCIITLFGFEGMLAKALFLSSAMPTSVSNAIIAQEYDNHPDFASQTVVFSTLASACTVTVVIFLSGILF